MLKETVREDWKEDCNDSGAALVDRDINPGLSTHETCLDVWPNVLCSDIQE